MAELLNFKVDPQRNSNTLIKDNVPISGQIKQYLYWQIITGKLKAGEVLPTARTIALALTVNLNVTKKALHELVNEGVLYKQKEHYLVTGNLALISQRKQELVDDELNEVVQALNSRGINNKQISYSFDQILKVGE